MLTPFLTCDSEGETGSEEEMGEGGRRKRGEGVMATGMLRELLLVAIVLGEEEVRTIRWSGRVSTSMLGLRGRWTMTGGVRLEAGEEMCRLGEAELGGWFA